MHLLQKKYKNGVSALEDIKTLGGNKINPLVDRASFHFSEVKREAEKSINSLDDFKSISIFLEKTIDRFVNKAFLEKFSANHLNYKKNISQYDISHWNKLLEIMPTVLMVGSIFPFKRDLEVSLGSNDLIIQGQISEIQDLKKYRKVIYAATRKLLSLNVLLTFKLQQGSDKNLYFFKLSADFSHTRQQDYILDFRKEKGIVLGFSNSLSNYRLSKCQLAGLGRHLCVEITSELKVEKFYRLPDHYNKDMKGKQLLHLPFLFRPVSIILPREGMLISSNSFRHLEDTGSGLYIGKQEVGRTANEIYRFIDIFLLINS